MQLRHRLAIDGLAYARHHTRESELDRLAVFVRAAAGYRRAAPPPMRSAAPPAAPASASSSQK